MANPEIQMNLDEAVAEVFGLLTGLDLEYLPEQDRYQAVVRCINRALRSVALEQEWSYYADVASIGPAVAGQSQADLPPTLRARMVDDDSVRLVDADGHTRVWASFLPRDSIHKYETRGVLRCAVTRTTIEFSRPFTLREDGLEIMVPVMREPIMFRLTPEPPDPDSEDPYIPVVPMHVRLQLVDFFYPDLVILRAAHYYAQTDPVMQPRVQTIEAQYKDLMYQIMERDNRKTDSPYLNEFHVPVSSGIVGDGRSHGGHPHADGGRY